MTLDRVCQRYKQLPSEVIGLSPMDWSINVITALAGQRQDEEDYEEAKAKYDNKTSVRPGGRDRKFQRAVERRKSKGK